MYESMTMGLYLCVVYLHHSHILPEIAVNNNADSTMNVTEIHDVH